MARFEVFIPGREQSLPNVTLTVDAPNWIGALRSGLKSIGEGQEAIANVMCDIKEDNSIHVTDVATRRVFRLREVAEGAASPPAEAEDPKTLVDGPRPVSMPGAAPLPASGPADFGGSPKTLIEFPAASAPLPSPRPQPAPVTVAVAAPASAVAPTATSAPVPPSVEARDTAPVPVAAPVSVGAPAAPAVVTPPPRPVAPAPAAAPPSAVAAPTVPVPRPARPASQPISPPTPRGVPAPAPKRPSGQFAAAPQPTSREVSKPKPTDPRIGREKQAPSVDVQEAIATVFDATQDLYMRPALSAQTVADTLLDIALQHIPAESGTFYLADVNGHELAFTSVRGPKADALKKSGLSVKVGQGIIGFCAQEGICLVVSDIQKDPRFYSAIARSIDYQPQDTVCASAEKDGRLFGALQLINSRGDGGFDAAHMEVLRFIGLTAAAMLERIAEQQ